MKLGVSIFSFEVKWFLVTQNNFYNPKKMDLEMGQYYRGGSRNMVYFKRRVEKSNNKMMFLIYGTYFR